MRRRSETWVRCLARGRNARLRRAEIIAARFEAARLSRPLAMAVCTHRDLLCGIWYRTRRIVIMKVILPKRFSLVLIKPSHYDDDGYLIQWFRSAIPSNTLAVMNGLALECKQRRALGDDVEIEVSAFDETNTRIRPERIARQLRDGRGMVALVGV